MRSYFSRKRAAMQGFLDFLSLFSSVIKRLWCDFCIGMAMIPATNLSPRLIAEHAQCASASHMTSGIRAARSNAPDRPGGFNLPILVLARAYVGLCLPDVYSSARQCISSVARSIMSCSWRSMEAAMSRTMPLTASEGGSISPVSCAAMPRAMSSRRFFRFDRK